MKMAMKIEMEMKMMINKIILISKRDFLLDLKPMVYLIHSI